MFAIETARKGRSMVVAAWMLCLACPALADDPPKPDSPLVKALRAGKVPEERLSAVVASVVKRGSAQDLGYVFNRVVDPKGFSPAVRLKAMEAFAEMALTGKHRPDADLGGLAIFLESAGGKPEPSLRRMALQLAGAWKVEPLVPQLADIAARADVDVLTRSSALDALAAIGTDPSLAAIRHMAGPDAPRDVRIPAVAALARFEPDSAAQKAVELIQTAEKGQDLTPLMGAFLNRQDGAALLANAIGKANLPADNAKLALRAVYALGRADESLVASLSKAAGIAAETAPPTKEDVDRLVAEVTARGDAARGEQVFRRVDLNCMKCHAISGAAGGVGPDLSAVGLSSPIDFVINSILMPDQAIKEQYHTLAVATTDGQVFNGIVADRDEQKVVLREATGSLRTIPTDEIEESKPGGSLMPKGLANLLTRDEFVDLVKFVSELGKPGTYAIHPTPTIQRWRLMKPVPEDLASAPPDQGAFVARIRDSDPSAWFPAYALSTGAIPFAEFAAIAESPVLYLQGEIDVSSPGPVTFRLGSAEKTQAWIDGDPQAPGVEMTRPLEAGRHAITLRIDGRSGPVEVGKVEVLKPAGSPAQMVVVGGR